MDKLIDVKKYIMAREPIFHHREFTNSRQDVERETTSDYFEISASGCDYSREFVLDYLEKRYSQESVDDMVKDNWKVKNFKIKRLASELYLVNYTLFGQGRVTKRGEIWTGSLSSGLKIMYHQGTVVVPERVKEHKDLLKQLKTK
ncbi:MAG: DUF4440 domain-containing protein [Clostridia bacterium]|nr:DUF4440 domain-containing protein [Clostridia bacterium]